MTTESKSYIKKAKSIYWGTPLNIYIPLMKAAYYDPCPAFATFDGLAIDWVQKQKLFVNPPFGKAMDAFCRKCMETFLEAKHQQAFLKMYHSVNPIFRMQFLSSRIRIRLLKAKQDNPSDVNKILNEIWNSY